MIRVFLTICFLGGPVDGDCLAEMEALFSPSFAREAECRAFLRHATNEAMIVRVGNVEMRYRCTQRSKAT